MPLKFSIEQGLEMSEVEQNEDQPFVRTESENRREIEFEKSDRIQLIIEANDLIENLSRKDIEPAAMGSMKQIDWTDTERNCYDAALDFLRREFEKGPKLDQHWDKVFENKMNIEYET